MLLNKQVLMVEITLTTLINEMLTKTKYFIWIHKHLLTLLIAFVLFIYQDKKCDE